MRTLTSGRVSLSAVTTVSVSGGFGILGSLPLASVVVQKSCGPREVGRYFFCPFSSVVARSASHTMMQTLPVARCASSRQVWCCMIVSSSSVVATTNMSRRVAPGACRSRISRNLAPVTVVASGRGIVKRGGCLSRPPCSSVEVFVVGAVVPSAELSLSSALRAVVRRLLTILSWCCMARRISSIHPSGRSVIAFCTALCRLNLPPPLSLASSWSSCARWLLPAPGFRPGDRRPASFVVAAVVVVVLFRDGFQFVYHFLHRFHRSRYQVYSP
mmetsp:Transcript_66333/g.192177  ORF Transcript_66333/g.192177 Transcript_66333/m.192177 type:complete len:272 (+) Transcript_66333:785-1600(+)